MTVGFFHRVPLDSRHDLGVDVELQPGREAVVRVAVATLWTSPEAVRPVDRPALTAGADIRTWVSGMDTDQQVGDCVLSQLLLGERVLISELRPDGWARVVAVEQPAAKLDPRGYPGWLPAEQLAVPDPAHTSIDHPLVVDATVTGLHAAPNGPVALPGVVVGTRLVPAGPTLDDWRPVHVPGRATPLWLPDGHLVPSSAASPTAEQALAVAQRLLDVVYIWGGLSAHGIDCSGLVHLAWRRFGVLLPRDADDQAVATTPLSLGAERPGDLYFFARPGRKIHHIGIVTAVPGDDGQRRMLHACYRRRRVIEEELPADRTATLVGAHRV
ncbi:Gamma-D-glutamyl-L-lysine endopeptidase [Micromonospora saelicesensis]|uniref:Cell wall-associated hydrolase, NlpC family n=1 Tax=Micromonospora saelicesensis TaxID=285676 RepID=A0A1C5A673_9ACTN|nr:C40 family peptidase [Micromonospora saelicesensis]RAO41416.1 Gamma-D-glutamyl-L-lysine endopeptidase [Micromonospora saelicesensis]RAO54446.1 Gamma-D-glutamyl-L-lysine endopeptidase [Micromonospora saelicesensis]SCF40659.1 Cell wall-associated hydrolase, NlpC family [Micromonospora saelicesensis]